MRWFSQEELATQEQLDQVAQLSQRLPGIFAGLARRRPPDTVLSDFRGVVFDTFRRHGAGRFMQWHGTFDAQIHMTHGEFDGMNIQPRLPGERKNASDRSRREDEQRVLQFLVGGVLGERIDGVCVKVPKRHLARFFGAHVLCTIVPLAKESETTESYMAAAGDGVAWDATLSKRTVSTRQEPPETLYKLDYTKQVEVADGGKAVPARAFWSVSVCGTRAMHSAGLEYPPGAARDFPPIDYAAFLPEMHAVASIF